MKKIIQIQIEYPKYDGVCITDSDLRAIQNGVMNQLCIVESVADDRVKIVTEAFTLPNDDPTIGKYRSMLRRGEVYAKNAWAWSTQYNTGYVFLKYGYIAGAHEQEAIDKEKIDSLKEKLLIMKTAVYTLVITVVVFSIIIFSLMITTAHEIVIMLGLVFTTFLIILFSKMLEWLGWME